jgi:hypothetical protein
MILKPDAPATGLKTGAQRARWVPPALLSISLLGAIVLRFYRLGEPGLIGDESYYWLWSEHLAPSYFDHPSGVALLVRASTLLGGPSEVGIRWFNAALGIGAIILAYLIGRRLFSQRAGLIAAALLALGAPYAITARFVYTDALHLFLLLLNLYLILPFLTGNGGGPSNQEKAPPASWRFWAVGLSMAALLNTKYSAYLYALVILGLLVGMRRDLLHDHRTWWAVSIALAGFLPTLIWNATHAWVSFHWQIEHFTRGALHPSTFWGRILHLVDYFSPPLALAAVIGVIQFRQPNQRILLLPALILTLPTALSPANSPRNLTTGVVLLLLLTADVMAGWVRRNPTVGSILIAVGLISTALWGIGSVIETLQPTRWPHNSVATAIRYDGAGWRQAKALDLDPENTILAVDYSIASQLRYYTGLPVQTSWGQYRLWGIPPIDDVKIVALTYIEPSLITERLHSVCQEVTGPEEHRLTTVHEEKIVRTWQARRCTTDVTVLLDSLDLLNLATAEARPR